MEPVSGDPRPPAQRDPAGQSEPAPLFELPPAEPAPARQPRAVRRRQPKPQPSLFSAVLADPRPADVAGILAGSGQVVRMGGTARVSVVVADEWRASALLAAFDERGLAGSRVPTVDGHIGVRTAFCAALADLAEAWLSGTVKRPPPGFRADGLALRLWAISGGRRDSIGYLLPLPAEDAGWRALRIALRVAGFDAELLSSGPALRVAGRADLITLADLLGPAPADAPAEAWPR